MINRLTLTILFFNLIFAYSYTYSADDVSSFKLDRSDKVKIIVSYANSFSNLEELFDELTKMKMLPLEQRAEIEKFARLKKISLKQKLSRVLADKDKMRFGKHWISLVDDSVIMNEQGVIVKLKNKPFDKVFKEIYNARTGKTESYAILDLLIPKASAVVSYEKLWNDCEDFVVGTLAVIASAGHSVAGIATNIGGFIFEHMAAGYRHFSQTTEVFCDQVGRYRVRFDTETAEWLQDYYWQKENNRLYRVEHGKNTSTISNGYWDAPAGFYMAGYDAFQNAFSADKAVKAARLQKVWPGAEIPVCTKESAASVEQSIRNEAKETLNKIFLAIANSNGPFNKATFKSAK